ncbi:MAG: class I SAM-dependent DNA methyltransferase [Verrucomicrobia bacterium]|jgi:type II restriction/modification system DNA methylase subunit YeeA|nr:class I SAM-dependent DNA methyltransferase [Verrucomicrobiota bacterium]
MTSAEFIRKWHRFQGKESAAYQSHFDDLCRLVGVPTPLEADPSGEVFCFQKRVVKDAELLNLETPDEREPDERGFADVWKQGCFGWEYKGKKKNLDEAYKQLLRYRESLLNPPLLVVCDFDRYIIKTNFNGTVPETHEFTNDQLDRPEILRLLRALFEDPEFLKPQRTTAEVTENLAAQIGEIARSLQQREAVELAGVRTRQELDFAQRKNLRIARFLNRIVFCFFAEDTGLLPKGLFTDLLKAGLDDLHHFAVTLEKLFEVMAGGGTFGKDKIRHFNGHLFEDATVFELTEAELRRLADASEADWQCIQPSIMGTLFQRALDESQRAALGAQYTGEPDIRDLVEPVLMAPLRREWAALKADLLPAFRRGRGTAADRERLAAFLKKLRAVIVMDPACGSGNFLYVSLQMLLDLEKEVLSFAIQLGFRFEPGVGVQQLRAIEINPYAYELAQVSVQIGWLQWRRNNGFDNDRSPVLQDLDGFHNEDALLVPHFRSKAKTLKEAQAGEHAGDDALKFYTERDWPKCDVIVGNPPFLGDKLMRGELGDGYVEELRRIYGNRIPGQSDLCCYWFEKARALIEEGKCRRAGLLATQGIRGGANREVLKRIKETGDIFFAESDREWVLAGANVHVSMVGFDNGRQKEKILDGQAVKEIYSNLASLTGDTTTAKRLQGNATVGFIGTTKKAPLDVPETQAVKLLSEPSPNGLPNSDVILPYLNALDLTRRPQNVWIIDFPVSLNEHASAKYSAPFGYVKEHVWHLRKNHREPIQVRLWWRLARPCPEMKASVHCLPRFLITPTVSKYRLFVWTNAPANCDHQLVVFARADDYSFGVLQSRFHEVWALKQGTRLETRPRYTPTTCFETFPFPFPDDLSATDRYAPAPPKPPVHPDLTPEKAYGDAAHFYAGKEDPPPYSAGSSGRKSAHSSPEDQSRLTSAATEQDLRAAIAAAARELNDLRERWLNPPEWTETRVLEFPGTVGGPWERYIDQSTVREVGRRCSDAGGAAAPPYRIGTVRYPRLVPRDAECAAKLKKRTLTNLYNERPAWLDLAHKNLDAAVAAAYGWPADLSDEQILEKLLALNLERAAEEAKAATVKKPARSRAKSEDEML